MSKQSEQGHNVEAVHDGDLPRRAAAASDSHVPEDMAGVKTAGLCGGKFAHLFVRNLLPVLGRKRQFQWVTGF